MESDENCDSLEDLCFLSGFFSMNICKGCDAFSKFQMHQKIFKLQCL